MWAKAPAALKPWADSRSVGRLQPGVGDGKEPLPPPPPPFRRPAHRRGEPAFLLQTIQRRMHRAEGGIVNHDPSICIGCKACAVACPYQARTIVHDKKWYYGKETAQERQVSHDDRIGVANKCTFCKLRLVARSGSSGCSALYLEVHRTQAAALGHDAKR